MPRYRVPRPGSKYYLPKYEYKTVVSFCMQYWDLRSRVASCTGLKGVNYDGMPHGTSVSDPTYQSALQGAEAARKVDIIESAVRRAAPDLYEWILKSVTEEDMTYDKLRYEYGMPCGKNLYAKKRRLVFWYVSKEI